MSSYPYSSKEGHRVGRQKTDKPTEGKTTGEKIKAKNSDGVIIQTGHNVLEIAA